MVDEEHRRSEKRDREGAKDERDGKRAKKDSKRDKRHRRDRSEEPETEPRSTRDGDTSKPVVDSSNGEISMSIEETNRVRISLGLKPLNVDSQPQDKRKEQDADALRAEETRKAKEADYAKKLKDKKEARAAKDKLRNVKHLGEAGDDVDDIKAWAARSKKAEEVRKKQERLKAERLAKQLDEQDGSESDEELLRDGTELAGMKVRHNAEELNHGETMILTLADRSILDDKGEIVEDAEELENTLVTEDRLRRKARKAATKDDKLFWGEDGEKKALLAQYDEEEAEAGMEIDHSGTLEMARQQRQAEIRAKLKQAEAQSTATAPAASFREGGDFYTVEEMAKFQPKQRKKRKIRKKEADEEDASLDISVLEAEAAQKQNGHQDRGSRNQRASKDQRDAAERDLKEQDRKARYDNALSKANAAALALKQASEATPEENEEVNDEDEELQANLARARLAAKKKAETRVASTDELLLAAEQRRKEREKQENEQRGNAVILSETTDFANNIQVKQEEPSGDPLKEMHEEEEAVPLPVLETRPENPVKSEKKTSGWVSADNVGSATEDKDTEMADVSRVKEEEEPENSLREKKVGTGLAGAMAMLREKGELKTKVEWAGRNNDKKPNMLQGLDDVYQSGNHESMRDANIERALTQRDAFGRVMTPKERFRDLCHNFHGKTISKTKQEKQQRRMQEELEARRAATGEGSANAFARILGSQVAGTPYTVISGKVQPGQSSDPASGFASIDHTRLAPTPVHGSLTPRLGGSQTPLIGDRKVELMMGLKKGDSKDDSERGTMPPPKRNFRGRN